MGTIDRIADAVRSRSHSAGVVTAHALALAEAAQPALNAFTRIAQTEATQRAEGVDAAVASGSDPGPLAGVPIALKDLVDQAGVPNTLGSAYPPIVPDADAAVVTRLQAAGAVIIGRTGLHEFAFGFSSENEHFGPVRNPWDPALSPGGSSGGSAAAVAAGIVPMAVGTDTGGSIRVPAALCGVMGLKPTHGRVPLEGVYPLAPSLDTVGPIARTVADLAVSFAVLADTTIAVEHLDIADIRLGLVRPWFERPMADPEVWTAVVDSLRRAGVAIEVVDDAVLAVPEALGPAAGVEIADVHRERWERDRTKYGRDVAARLETAFSADPALVAEAETWAAAANAALDAVFAGCHAVLSPTVGVRRKTIGVDTVDVEGVPSFYRPLLSAWTAPINRLRLPALSLPVPGTGAPPMAIHLVGPAFGEDLLLSIASALETAGVVASERPPVWFE